ncbi:hypothetical protein OG2516_07380 [Oceanicola granulosus HTCC2516]|uniref:AraC effector-binding domain-containing protein n=1 Tax=Oceanicola granulosus (strain ATCC BAA-861 / DSM 15982 / KCTC 12143 / HTCC2516) TaxID=314256 RepID=Q2CBF8_OCEGH|nr:GyrI-like domain-containing protein [Oceanicola granulosus]EAR50005.1 hypothetical protein OG2516_07380 [Oceanicola granulosus HTCC2516]
MDYYTRTLEPQTYVYVDRDCAFEAGAIAAAMGSGIREVLEAVSRADLAVMSPPMAIYESMEPERLRFRVGVLITPEHAGRSPLRVGELPGGEAVHTVHTGPYATLNATHRALDEALAADGHPHGWPVWEVYVDDPSETPEAELRTEIWRSLG